MSSDDLTGFSTLGTVKGELTSATHPTDYVLLVWELSYEQRAELYLIPVTHELINYVIKSHNKYINEINYPEDDSIFIVNKEICENIHDVLCTDDALYEQEDREGKLFKHKLNKDQPISLQENKIAQIVVCGFIS